jgi:hypothetical protein
MPIQQQKISILLPTRGRPDLLKRSVFSLLDTASNTDGIEILLAIDDDDPLTIDYVNNELVPELNDRDVAMRAFTFKRLGYLNLHLYVNHLARESMGEWMILWNDDAVMQTDNWDLEIAKYNGQFKVLRFKDNHNEHPNAIFPCIPKDWVALFDVLTPHQVTDSWVSQVAYIVGIIQNVPSVYVYHDRHDLTGNNNDQTAQERMFDDNNPHQPTDLNHPDQLRLKLAWGKKLNWYLQRIGQSPGWLDQWLKDPKNFDLWSTFKENDPNNQCFTSLEEREEIVKNKKNLVQGSG